MNIKKIITAGLIAAGLTLSFAQPAEARHRRRVVKHKHVHHRHYIGLKHIGRGTKTKTVVKRKH